MPQPRKPRSPAEPPTPPKRRRAAKPPSPPKRPVRPLDTSDVVLTPGGGRPRSLVHTLEPGHHVSLKDGRVRIIETATGKVVKDLGEYATHGNEPEAQPLAGQPGPTPALPDIAWIENSQWRNGGANPIISFTTSWIVPPAPTSDDSQTVFLFNGLQPDDAAHILQPVLQWGSSGAGGGKYWSIANWYADGQGGTAVNSSVIQVAPGTVLTGVITCTQQTATGFDYTCKFVGYPSIDVSVTDAPQLTWAFETLECYGSDFTKPLTQCSDYPPTPLTAMYGIEIKTGTPGTAGTDATIEWSAVTNFTDCGQSCEIVSNDSPGGAVYLYYKKPPRTLYFVNDKSSFGKDEVADQIAAAGGVFPAAIFIALDGFTVQQLTIDQPQLAAPTVSGPFSSLPGVSVYPSTTYQPSYDPTNLYTPQRILYPFDVQFTSAALTGTDFPASGVTPERLDASIVVGAASAPNQQTLTASTVIKLGAGADPYFANVDPAQDNVTYLSQDLRVFTIAPTASGTAPVDGVTWNFQGGGPMSFDSAAAYQYIRDLIGHFNSNYGDPNGVDPFDINSPRLPSQGAVYSGDSTVTPASVDFGQVPPIALNYNFALARVRLQGSSGPAGQASDVRVFFRLFTTQTFDTDYINTAAAVSGADPNITYPSLPVGSPNAPASPLPGTDAGATINGCSLPYFAAADQSDLGPGGVNHQTILIPAGHDKTWAYFGCFLDVYDSSYLIGGFDSQHWLVGSSHCCLVAQIAYDGLPIENSNGVIENPGNCAQLAQRNLQVTLTGNPGFPETHLIPQTFDTRPSPPATTAELGEYPDELMIDWRNTPPGTTASIYWPSVDSADVLALAARFYPSSTLAAVDGHTIKCEVTPGMTYVPVPSGAGESFAGLITLQLPAGIRVGNQFDVVIRRITSRRFRERTLAATSESAAFETPRLFNWRYVVGAFQMTIPVADDAAILPGEENLLAVLKWRLGRMGSSDRWYRVLKAYVGIVERRVRGLGGDPSKIEPNPLGLVPPPERRPKHRAKDLEEYTGKVIGIGYDRFGDFEGFELLTLQGHEHHFHGRERRIEELLREAWLERHLITVVAPRHDPDWPAEIILRRA
jgi:hypothetical protein